MNKRTDLTKVDELIKHFWKNGYLTVSRKHGTYLPAPQNIGKYSVDAIAKKVKNYAIGITLSKEDLSNQELIEKLKYLATRHQRFSKKDVKLFVGVPKDHILKAKAIVLTLDEKVRKNIKLVALDPPQYIN